MNVIHELSTLRIQRKRRKKTEEIVDVSMDIVLSQGFGALTMSHVAERLELTAGALYRYFSSKDALIGALEAQAISQLHSLLDAERAKWRPTLPADLDAGQAAIYELVAVGRFYQDLLVRQPRLFRLVSATLADTKVLVTDERAASGVALSLGGILACVGEMFDTAHGTPGPRKGALCRGDAEERTAIYWSSHHGALGVDKLGRFAPTLRATRLGPALRRVLLVGWGADETIIDRAEAWAGNKGNEGNEGNKP
jgi:AcrR family transcriptional regulator